MPEDQDSEPLDMERYFDVVRRRTLFPYISIPWVVPSLGCQLDTAAKVQVGHVIFVEQPTMPKDYVTPNVTEEYSRPSTTLGKSFREMSAAPVSFI